MTKTRKVYRGTVQAEVSALSRQRILESARHFLEEGWIKDVTLQQIAGDANVTVQTVLRHFKSKDGVFEAVGAIMREGITTERDAVTAGEIDEITDYLIRHYEEMGDRVIRWLAQEEVYPLLLAAMEEGRGVHRAWVRRVFAPRFASDSQADQLAPQLTVVCDVYVWKLLRRDMKFSVPEYEDALNQMIKAILQT